MKDISNKISILVLGTAFTLTSNCTLAQTVTYQFDNATATGSTGPSQAQVNAAYLSTNLNGSVEVTGGIQSFTIPATGLYGIEAAGASGGDRSTLTQLGGLGSKLFGEFQLSQGDVIKILVGQKGTDGGNTGAGGGGSFVEMNGTILIAAGGGGGATGDNHGAHSTTITSGTNDYPGGSISGGANGSGGLTCIGSGANHGGGGGGYIGDGETSTQNSPGGGGLSFTNGGTGGSGPTPGGFGGGGGVSTTAFGGGGGGGGLFRQCRWPAS